MRQYSRGFTLVEVMVALTLATLLLSVVYASLRTGVDSSARVNAAIVENDEERVMSHFLRTQLRQIETLGITEAARFSGDAAAFHFSVRHLHGNPALRSFSVSLAPGARGAQLEIDETGGGPESQTEFHAVLLSALDELSFAYFGLAADADQPDWHAEWDSEYGLPQLLRVTYRRARAPRRELYLALSDHQAESTSNAQ